MKKLLFIATLCIVMILVGCTNKNETNPSEASDVNNTGVYPGAEEVADITMGTNFSGTREELCVIKIPTNYFIASGSLDENGGKTMLETNGKLYSEVLEAGGLEDCELVPGTVVLQSQGNADDKFTFAITDSGTVNVESEKEFAPGGIDVDTVDGHAAYAYMTTGQFDVIVVYEINDDWTLLIENRGQLKDEMSIEEIGEKFCRLVTPLE